LWRTRPARAAASSAQQVKAAPANQSVLLLANPAVMVVAPLVFKDNGYDAERDFTPVSQVNRLRVWPGRGHGRAGARTLPPRGLAAQQPREGQLRRARHRQPAALLWPDGGRNAAVQREVIGYRGSGPLLTDLIGGQVPVAFDTLDTLLPQAESGKLRILATSGAKRSRWSPAVPTFKEAGLDLVATGWNTFFAPMPACPRRRPSAWPQLIREVMKDPDTQRKFADAKMEPVVSTQAQTEAMLKAYRAQWAPVVQRSGFSPDPADEMTTRPNIIFIVADDLGFADLGCYGGRATPNFGPVSPVLDAWPPKG
jgi:hypothetical protein